MRVELSYEERIINTMLYNREYRQKRGEHFTAYDQRCFNALRAILQPLYDELDALRAAAPAQDGAEWAESRYRELVEAAREYRDELNAVGIVTREDDVVSRLLAAAAALKEEGGE